MLIKRMLLVALVATGTMNFGIADVSVLAPQYGVQNSSLDANGLASLIELLVESGNFNTDRNALAGSSMVRAQLTNSGDTTLAGIGISNDVFNRLFPNYQDAVRQAFNVLLTSNVKSEREEAGRIIMFAAALSEGGWLRGQLSALTPDHVYTNSDPLADIAAGAGTGADAATAYYFLTGDNIPKDKFQEVLKNNMLSSGRVRTGW